MEENNLELYQEKVKIIRDLLDKVSNSKYIGPLDLQYIDGMYIVRLGANCREASPVCIGYTGDWNSFLKFIEKEFRKRRFSEITYTNAKIINGESPMFYPIIEL